MWRLCSVPVTSLVLLLFSGSCASLQDRWFQDCYFSTWDFSEWLLGGSPAPPPDPVYGVRTSVGFRETKYGILISGIHKKGLRPGVQIPLRRGDMFLSIDGCDLTKKPPDNPYLISRLRMYTENPDDVHVESAIFVRDGDTLWWDDGALTGSGLLKHGPAYKPEPLPAGFPMKWFKKSRKLQISEIGPYYDVYVSEREPGGHGKFSATFAAFDTGDRIGMLSLEHDQIFLMRVSGGELIIETSAGPFAELIGRWTRN